MGCDITLHSQLEPGSIPTARLVGDITLMVLPPGQAVVKVTEQWRPVPKQTQPDPPLSLTDELVAGTGGQMSSSIAFGSTNTPMATVLGFGSEMPKASRDGAGANPNLDPYPHLTLILTQS